MAGTVFVGRWSEVPVGEQLLPEPKRQSYQREPGGEIIVSMMAATGIVNGTLDRRHARFLAAQDAVYQYLGPAFRGEVSARWDVAQQKQFYIATKLGRSTMGIVQAAHGHIGHVHAVVGDFEPTTKYSSENPWDNEGPFLIGGPNMRISTSAVKVVGVEPVTLSGLEKDFGSGLPGLLPMDEETQRFVNAYDW